MDSLMEILEGYRVGDPEREDEMLWIRDEDGWFSVRLMYEELSLPKLESSSRCCTWNPLIQLKVSLFV